ncbi:platelet glycoprotein 4 isoform X1 [Leptinotarsa decemlineata]|uniref:platelet glycoprotein 4 isoform X1 n=2 Tax=Leptinotarsa decemlineata TaxID=7539 RepID=UPI003D30B3AA
MFPTVVKTIGVSEDEISNGRTEDSLLSSRTSNESVNSENKKSKCYETRTEEKNGHNIFLLSAVFFLFFATAIIIYPPYDFLMSLRIRMTPGLPPYEWWLNPPDEVIFKLYIFNVTNSEEFMNGTDSKIKVKEIGPITYREKLIHTFPVFNDNGTFTYTANRTPIYLPEMNPIDFRNETIIMPNMAVLFIPSYFYDAPFLVKFGINLMMRKLQSNPFVKTTIQDFLWNSSDPILDLSQNLAPRLVPTKNVGILARIYADYTDNVTVNIGPTFEERNFFLIDNYDGSKFLPFRAGKCEDTVQGSSEGVSYPQNLRKNDTIRYFRKTLCKVAELNFREEVNKYGVTAYKYVMDPLSYSRTSPKYKDCYKGQPTLPNGLIDVSPCYYDTAIGASFPHFLYGDEELSHHVDGLEPDKEKHESYVIIEPRTGVPLNGAARSQINLVVKNMNGFNDKVKKFSNLSIPLVWIEYIQMGIPWYIQALVYSQVIIMPVLQIIFSIVLFIGGIILIFLFFRKRRTSKSNLIANRAIKFEAEKFLKP